MRAPRPPAAAFIVADIDQALAVFAAAETAAQPLHIESPPGYGAFAGGGFWKALLDAAARAHPGATVDAVLDCGEEAGAALAAIRAGVPAIRCRLRGPARARLKALAARAGVGFAEGRRPAACDITAAGDPARAVARELARRGRLKMSHASAIPEANRPPRRRKS